MKREEIIKEIKDKGYFVIQELVCRHTYTRFGDMSWQFLDTELLHTLLVIRQNIGRAIYVNNWDSGGSLSQRGLRCNICQLVKSKTANNQIYLTAHSNGAGVDFDVKGMTAPEVRKWIKANAHLLPYAIRLEEAVTWVHLDIYDPCNGKKINTFSA